MKRFAILSLFPAMFPGPLGVGVVGRGIERGLLSIEGVDIRDYAKGRHRITDEPPYGGGGGMVMKPEPILEALDATRAAMPPDCPALLMSPQGETFNQSIAHELAQLPGLILICGRYEGIDERVRLQVDRELSAGDFVVSGGEIPAMVILDAVSRLVPGVLGNPDSLTEESFQRPFIEYPQYTRPASYRGLDVPDVLLSGNHERIRRWRLKQSILRTLQRRPELLQDASLSKEERAILREIQNERQS